VTNPRYHLDLEALPGNAPPEVRMRRLLKTLLRAYGMRCIAIEEIRPEKAPERARGEGDDPE